MKFARIIMVCLLFVSAIAVMAPSYGPYSNTEHVTTYACSDPDAVTGMTVSGVDGDSLLISWNDISASEDGYRLYWCEGISCGTFSELVELASGTTSFQHDYLTNGPWYKYAVRPFHTGPTYYACAKFKGGKFPTPTPTPTPVPDPFLRGIATSDSSSGFYKGSATTHVDIGANDSWIITFSVRRVAAGGLVLSTQSTGSPAPYIRVYFYQNTELWAEVITDSIETTNAGFTVPNYVNDGMIHRYTIAWNRGGLVTCAYDNSSCGSAAFTATGAVTNAVFSIGNNYVGSYGGSMEYFEFAMGVGVTSLGNADLLNYYQDSSTGMKTHWKFQELSGNITDSKNAVVLTSLGGNTYSVPITPSPTPTPTNTPTPTPSPTPTPTPAPDAGSCTNATACWLLDETSGSVVDEIASISLPVVNSPTFSVTGSGAVYEPGITYSSNTSHTKETGSSAINVGANEDFTYEFIFKNTACASGYEYLASYNSINASTFGHLIALQDDTTLYIDFKDDDGAARQSYTQAISDVCDGTDHYIRIWADHSCSVDSKIHIYVDDVEQGTGTSMSGSCGHAYTNDGFRIAGQYNGGTATFTGTMWHVVFTKGANAKTQCNAPAGLGC